MSTTINPEFERILSTFENPQHNQQTNAFSSSQHLSSSVVEKPTVWQLPTTIAEVSTSSAAENPLSHRQVSEIKSATQPLATGGQPPEAPHSSSAREKPQHNSVPAANTESSESIALADTNPSTMPQNALTRPVPEGKESPQDNTLLQQVIATAKELSTLVERTLTTNQLERSSEAKKELQDVRDRIGILLGTSNLSAPRKLALINNKNDRETMDARSEALCNCLTSELQMGYNPLNQTVKPPKTLIRTIAAATTAIMTMQYVQTASKVGLFSPSYKMMAAFAVPSLITASANVLGEQKTDHAIQWVQDKSIALKDHVLRNGTFYIWATKLLAVSGAALCKYTEHSMKRKLNFTFSGRATPKETAQSFAAEAAAIAAENFIESALGEFKLQVVDLTPPSKKVLNGIEGEFQGTILLSIAALVMRIAEAVKPTFKLAVKIGSEAVSQVINDLRDVPADDITRALSSP